MGLLQILSNEPLLLMATIYLSFLLTMMVYGLILGVCCVRQTLQPKGMKASIKKQKPPVRQAAEVIILSEHRQTG